jgi:hypothetical protein
MSAKQTKRQRAAERDSETAEHMMVVVEFLRGAVDKLRQEYARRLKFLRQRDPGGAQDLGEALTPCQTCAFRKPADFTDGNDGFLQTSCSLVNALDRGAAFMCHNPKQSGDEQYTPRDFPCVGWLTLQSPIPGVFKVRELLGGNVVDLMVEGDRIFNPERHKVQP